MKLKLLFLSLLLISLGQVKAVPDDQLVESSFVDEEQTLHLYSHGRPGNLLLDGKWQNAEQISQYISTHYGQVKNVNIYGCNFAKGTEGQNALTYIAQKLKASVAGSDDVTGVDGDWVLEVGDAQPIVQLVDYDGNLQTCAGEVGSMLPGGDFDGDGVCNDLDRDDDNDGIDDQYENAADGTTNPCSPSYRANVAKVCVNDGQNPVSGNPAYVLSAAELDRITDVNSGTGYSASWTGLPLIQAINTNINGATVSEIRIYNWAVTSNVGNLNEKHVKSINHVRLYNANREVVFSISNVAPVTTASGQSYYSIPVSPAVEGVTRLELSGIKSKDNIGFGLRDVFVVGCPTDHDGDGYPNKFDTDSDNDGCPDAVESNAVGPNTGYNFGQLKTDWSVDIPIDGNYNNGSNPNYGVPDGNRNNPVGTYNANQQAAECDGCSPLSTQYSDFDNDGVGDKCDVDADNDGITNQEECPGVGDFTADPLSDVDLNNAVILADPDPTDYIGPSLYKNAATTLPDGTCVDVRIDVEQTSLNGPSFSWNLTPTDGTKLFNGGANREYQFTVHYFECGTTTPIELSTIYKVVDIDGDGDWNGDRIRDWPLCTNPVEGNANDDYVFLDRGEYIDYYLKSPTLIVPIDAGSSTYFYSLGVNNSNYSAMLGIAPVDTSTQAVFIKFKKAPSFTFNYFTGGYGGIYMDFTYQEEAFCDMDRDGIPNYLDRDSDGDGCPDALESRLNPYEASDLDTNLSIVGWVDSIPTSPDYGVPNGQAYTKGVALDTNFVGPECYTTDTVITSPPSCPTCPAYACATGDDLDTTGGSAGLCNGAIPGFTITLDSAGCATFTPDGTVTDTTTTCVYICNSDGFCDTTVVIIPPPLNATEPDINVGIVDSPITGNLSTNDHLLPGTTYGAVTPLPGNPSSSVPVVNLDGTYTFVSSVPGVYEFEVEVCGPNDVPPCPTEHLQITVIDPDSTGSTPVANTDRASTLEDQPVDMDIRANDGPGYAYGELANPTITDQPQNGTVVVNPDGTVTYTPNTGFIGTDTFYYEVCDTVVFPPQCADAMGIVDVIPSTENGLTLTDDYNYTGKGFTAIGNALENDTDPNGDAMTVTAQPPTALPEGNFSIDAQGNYQFVPDPDFVGTVAIPYEVCDAQGLCKKATIYILVHENFVPLALDIISTDILSSECKVYVKWLLADITDVESIVLERGIGSTNFSTLEALEFDPDTKDEQWVVFTDMNPRAGDENIFYRLTFIDEDGSKSYSNILRSKLICGNNAVMDIYPNPATNKVSVELINFDDAKYELEIYNALGQNVMSLSNLQPVNGSLKADLDITNLASGHYMISIKDGDENIKILKPVHIAH